MTHEEIQERINHLTDAIEAMRPGWRYIRQELQALAASYTEQLVNQDSEQTRGRIKALRELMELPETLQSERDGMSAALSDMDAAL